MIKITIQVDDVVSTVEDPNSVTLNSLLQLVGQAIKGVGYYPPNGELAYDEES